MPPKTSDDDSAVHKVASESKPGSWDDFLAKWSKIAPSSKKKIFDLLYEDDLEKYVRWSLEISESSKAGAGNSWLKKLLRNMIYPPPREVYEFWVQRNYEKKKTNDEIKLEKQTKNEAGLARSKKFLVAYKHAGHRGKWAKSRNEFVGKLHSTFGMQYDISMLKRHFDKKSKDKKKEKEEGKDGKQGCLTRLKTAFTEKTKPTKKKKDLNWNWKASYNIWLNSTKVDQNLSLLGQGPFQDFADRAFSERPRLRDWWNHLLNEWKNVAEEWKEIEDKEQKKFDEEEKEKEKKKKKENTDSEKTVALADGNPLESNSEQVNSAQDDFDKKMDEQFQAFWERQRRPPAAEDETIAAEDETIAAEDETSAAEDPTTPACPDFPRLCFRKQIEIFKSKFKGGDENIHRMSVLKILYDRFMNAYINEAYDPAEDKEAKEAKGFLQKFFKRGKKSKLPNGNSEKIDKTTTVSKNESTKGNSKSDEKEISNEDQEVAREVRNWQPKAKSKDTEVSEKQDKSTASEKKDEKKAPKGKAETEDPKKEDKIKVSKKGDKTDDSKKTDKKKDKKNDKKKDKKKVKKKAKEKNEAESQPQKAISLYEDDEGDKSSLSMVRKRLKSLRKRGYEYCSCEYSEDQLPPVKIRKRKVGKDTILELLSEETDNENKESEDETSKETESPDIDSEENSADVITCEYECDYVGSDDDEETEENEYFTDDEDMHRRKETLFSALYRDPLLEMWRHRIVTNDEYYQAHFKDVNNLKKKIKKDSEFWVQRMEKQYIKWEKALEYMHEGASTTQKIRYTVDPKLKRVFENLGVKSIKDYEKKGLPPYKYYSFGAIRQHIPCCSDVARRFLDDYAMANQKIAQIWHDADFIQQIISFFVMVALGISFILNWVVIRSIVFTDGQPYPMFVEGACICNGELCDDVLFTFNLSVPSNEENGWMTSSSMREYNGFTNSWRRTQWWDYEANRGGFYSVPAATSIYNDTLISAIPAAYAKAGASGVLQNSANILIDGAQEGKHARFYVKDKKDSKTVGGSSDSKHEKYGCDVKLSDTKWDRLYGSDWELGSPWGDIPTEDEFCERYVTHKLRGRRLDKFTCVKHVPESEYDEEKKAILEESLCPPSSALCNIESTKGSYTETFRIDFFDTQMELHVPRCVPEGGSDSTFYGVPFFRSPVCGQGPHMFLAAGLRGQVKFSGYVDKKFKNETTNSQRKWEAEAKTDIPGVKTIETNNATDTCCFANDGSCDEPDYCAEYTDCTDCGHGNCGSDIKDPSCDGGTDGDMGLPSGDCSSPDMAAMAECVMYFQPMVGNTSAPDCDELQWMGDCLPPCFCNDPDNEENMKMLEEMLDDNGCGKGPFYCDLQSPRGEDGTLYPALTYNSWGSRTNYTFSMYSAGSNALYAFYIIFNVPVVLCSCACCVSSVLVYKDRENKEKKVACGASCCCYIFWGLCATIVQAYLPTNPHFSIIGYGTSDISGFNMSGYQTGNYSDYSSGYGYGYGSSGFGSSGFGFGGYSDSSGSSGSNSGSGPDSCVYALDDYCDEPYLCNEGTDTTDCAGASGSGSNSGSSSGDTCEYANDGVCDESGLFSLCSYGTDTSDCSRRRLVHVLEYERVATSKTKLDTNMSYKITSEPIRHPVQSNRKLASCTEETKSLKIGEEKFEKSDHTCSSCASTEFLADWTNISPDLYATSTLTELKKECLALCRNTQGTKGCEMRMEVQDGKKAGCYAHKCQSFSGSTKPFNVSRWAVERCSSDSDCAPTPGSINVCCVNKVCSSMTNESLKSDFFTIFGSLANSIAGNYSTSSCDYWHILLGNDILDILGGRRLHFQKERHLAQVNQRRLSEKRRHLTSSPFGPGGVCDQPGLEERVNACLQAHAPYLTNTVLGMSALDTDMCSAQRDTIQCYPQCLCDAFTSPTDWLYFECSSPSDLGTCGSTFQNLGYNVECWEEKSTWTDSGTTISVDIKCNLDARAPREVARPSYKLNVAGLAECEAPPLAQMNKCAPYEGENDTVLGALGVLSEEITNQVVMNKIKKNIIPVMNTGQNSSRLGYEGMCCNTISKSSDTSLLGLIFDHYKNYEVSDSELGNDEIVTSHCTPSMWARKYVLQAPKQSDDHGIRRNASDDACWLSEQEVGKERSDDYDNLIAERWVHGQKWQQALEYDNSKMVPVGIMLGTLCAIISFIECISSFLPDPHTCRRRCNVKQKLRILVCTCGREGENAKKEAQLKAKLDSMKGNNDSIRVLGCLCCKRAVHIKSVDSEYRRFRQMVREVQDDEKDTAVLYLQASYSKKNNEFGEMVLRVSDRQKKKEKKLGSDRPLEKLKENFVFLVCKCGCLTHGLILLTTKVSKFLKWANAEGSEDVLAFVLINMPFNFLIASYTVVGHDLFLNNEDIERPDGAGIWELGSESAILMISMPIYFMMYIVGETIFWSLRGMWQAFRANMEHKRGYGVNLRKDQLLEICSNDCLKYSAVSAFVAWLFVALLIFYLKFSVLFSTEFSFDFQELMFGVPIPFKVPGVQFPTAALSFSYGAIRISLIFSKMAKCKRFLPRHMNGLNKFEMQKSKVKIGELKTATAKSGKVNMSQKMNEELKNRLEKAKEEALETVKGKIAKGVNGSVKSAKTSMGRFTSKSHHNQEKDCPELIFIETRSNLGSCSVAEYGKFVFKSESQNLSSSDFPLGFDRDTIRDKYWKAFRTYDSSGASTPGEPTGIDFSEFKSIIKSLGMHLQTRDLIKKFKQIDDDGSNSIEFNEFLTLMYMQAHDQMAQSNEDEIIEKFYILWRSERDFVSDADSDQKIELDEPFEQVNMFLLTFEWDIDKKEGKASYKISSDEIIKLEEGDILRFGYSPHRDLKDQCNCDTKKRRMNIEFWEGRLIVVTTILNNTNDTNAFKFVIEEDVEETSKATKVEWDYEIARIEQNRRDAMGKENSKQKAPKTGSSENEKDQLKENMKQSDIRKKRRSTLSKTQSKSLLQKEGHADKSAENDLWPLELQSRWEAKGLSSKFKSKIRKNLKLIDHDYVNISKKSFKRMMQKHGQQYDTETVNKMMQVLNLGDRPMLTVYDLKKFFVTSPEEQAEINRQKEAQEERKRLAELTPHEQIKRLHKKVAELQHKLKSHGKKQGNSFSSWATVVPKVVALSAANKTMEKFAQGHLQQQKQLTILKRSSSKRLEQRLSLRKRGSVSSVIKSKTAFSLKKSAGNSSESLVDIAKNVWMSRVGAEKTKKWFRKRLPPQDQPTQAEVKGLESLFSKLKVEGTRPFLDELAQASNIEGQMSGKVVELSQFLSWLQGSTPENKV